MSSTTNTRPSSTVANTTTETPESTSSSTGNINGPWLNRINDASIRENRDFSGETVGIDAVLGLMSERLNKGKSFEKFKEKIANYVLKNLPKAEDFIILISEPDDPLQDFEN